MAGTWKTVGIGVACALVVSGAPPATAAPAETVRITRFLGEQRIPYKAEAGGTVVGGLSGIDRDPRTGTWYFISDDRNRYNPARVYTGRLRIDPATGAFSGVDVTGVITLRRPDGTPYPGFGKPGAADPESIRVDRWGRGLLWGDEGDRPDADHAGIPLTPAAVRSVDLRGRHLGALPLPRNLRLTTGETGPRRNAGFEGLAVTARVITAVTEGPRYEDGAPPTPGRGAPARVTVWGRDGKVRGQYAYPIDPLPAAPVPPTGRSDSGVSEILAVDDDRYLALERSWIEGVGYRSKLYAFDLRGASNVLGRDSLATGAPYRPVTKRLVHDLGSFRPPAQNLESLAWGPRLASGECTLVMGSDDNFDEREMTQFLVFAARGC